MSGITTSGERTAPVKIIKTQKKQMLGELLKMHKVAEEVEAGRSIIICEGKSLVDLTVSMPAGTTLAVISFEFLGGG